MICGSGGSKSVLKTGGLGPLLEVEMSKKCTPLWREAHFQVKMYKPPQRRTPLEVAMSKKCTPLWREAHFEVKMYKTLGVRTTFGSRDVQKVHAVVARSTFRSQNVQSTPFSDHFWKLRCRKSAHRCGAKHISKWKCTKHQGFGPLLEAQMSLRFASLHYTTLYSTTLHYMDTTHYTPLQLQLHNYTPLH